MRAPISLPAFFGVFVAHLFFLAVAHRLHAVGGNSKRIRKVFAASARRCPSPRLYSVEPRSSQSPSITTFTVGYVRRYCAVRERASRASARISAAVKIEVVHPCTCLVERCFRGFAHSFGCSGGRGLTNCDAHALFRGAAGSGRSNRVRSGISRRNLRGAFRRYAAHSGRDGKRSGVG